MVAYSFARMFADQVSALTKRQTVRAHRWRHARPGEPVQLYTGMRTKHCRKLVAVDPVCIALLPIAIDVSDMVDELIASIEIAGRPLHRDEIEAFARADGFSPEWRPRCQQALADVISARKAMGAFWQKTHGLGLFQGVIIKWEPLS